MRRCRPADRADGAAEDAACHAAQPGDLLSLDTFYVGKLKGVGKVWQITGCDAASSYTWAQLVVGEVTAGTSGASSRHHPAGLSRGGLAAAARVDRWRA